MISVEEGTTMTQDETRALVVAELRTAAEQSSRIQRQMAEGKSLRNSDGERRDLYMWPEPAQTLEDRAADLIERLAIPVNACPTCDLARFDTDAMVCSNPFHLSDEQRAKVLDPIATPSLKKESRDNRLAEELDALPNTGEELLGL